MGTSDSDTSGPIPDMPGAVEQARAADPAVWESMGMTALWDGQVAAARDCFQHAVRLGGPASSWVQLGRACRMLRDVAGAEQAFRGAVARDPTNTDSWTNLASLLAAQGRIGEAVQVLWQGREQGRPDPWLVYFLGGAFAAGGALEEAGRVFAFDIELPISATLSISTRVLRFGKAYEEVMASVREADVLPGLPSVRPDPHADLLCLLCCDGVYAERFLAASVNAYFENAGDAAAVHAHVVNPTAGSQALLARLSARHGARLTWSEESVDLQGVSDQARRTFFACRRFFVLPDLAAAFPGRAILCADVDQLAVKPIRPLLEGEDWDVALIHDPLNAINLCSFFSASVVLVRPGPGAEAYFRSVRRYLWHLLHCEPSAYWHLDQAALACVFLNGRGGPGGVRMRFLPVEVMQSAPVELDGEIGDAVFWSITGSVPENEAKTRTDRFLRYSEF
ncbi:tetratricopeptide repeat protein [Arenibaculum pallidiluteum]|uniref:tetratricopeptide repeat protein n=1 Tax=Arenibaculum pallidiluteum TaxID=2812559 RepID=UPI001A973D57|nr:tetratricopeptide repeat protein [Arenibaculum pallidiluteum]